MPKKKTVPDPDTGQQNEAVVAASSPENATDVPVENAAAAPAEAVGTIPAEDTVCPPEPETPAEEDASTLPEQKASIPQEGGDALRLDPEAESASEILSVEPEPAADAEDDEETAAAFLTDGLTDDPPDDLAGDLWAEEREALSEPEDVSLGDVVEEPLPPVDVETALCADDIPAGDVPAGNVSAEGDPPLAEDTPGLKTALDPEAASGKAVPAHAAEDVLHESDESSTAETPRRRSVRRTKKAAADTNQHAAPPAAEAPGVQTERTPTANGNDRRSFYELDFHALDRDLSPEQRQEWNSIYASYRGRSVLTGSIAGVDKHSVRVKDRKTGTMVRKQMYCATVILFRVRILIPAAEMWMQGEERPDFVLRNMSGANIDFVVTHVDREAGFAVASRRIALRTRRYYFSTQPSLNRSGTRIKCRVLAVGPRRCLVECGGYDIDLTQREMRYTAIPDLREQYRRGQELDCIVKSYDRELGRLVISVKETNPNPFDGAELRHPQGSRRQAEIAGKYAGGVFCNLPDGVVIMCSYSFHYEDAAFAIGDKVIVLIQHYDFGKKQIYGKIVAKW